MKPADTITIDRLKAYAGYRFGTSHSFDVYPGWAVRCVFEHVPSGTFWARDVYSSEDDSDEGMRWYEVVPQVITRYEVKR